MRLRGARRGLLRSARALAAAALLALCGGLALPATAQAEVLVSNIEEFPDGSHGLRGIIFAQGFTTGASESNFPLTSIEVKFQTVPSSGSTVTATVKRRNSSGRPGTDHATLVSPTSFVIGNNTFTAPAGTTLAANRTYFVVLETTSTSGPFVNVTNSDDEDGVPGWEMADGSMSSVSGGAFWTDRSQSAQIRVNGTHTGPPYVTAAEVSTDGQRVALTFNEILDHPTYTTTIRSAFTVTVDGTGTSVQSTSGGMDKVNLSVGRAISAGQTVVVSYDQSAAGTEALGDSDGNKVADFTTGRDGIPAVVNNSAVDLNPPELTGATVASSGVAIELAFDEALDLPATIPAALKDAFSVTAASDTVEIAGLAKDGSSGLRINLSSRILKDQAVVVSYDRSAAGTNALDDAAGNEVVDFTTGASGVPAVDNDSTIVPPTLSSALVAIAGDRIILDFSENLDTSAAAKPPASAFSVSAAGASIVVGSVAISSGQKTRVRLLSLDRLISQGQTVTVTYTDPTSGDDASAIQDSDGNDADSFTTGEDGVPAVTNGSTVVAASTDATLSDLTVTAGGTDLVTFASGTFTYTAMVETAVDEVTVTATKNDTNATIEYLDESDMMLDDADTGTAGHQVPVAVGDTVIKVKVTAQDTTTFLIYTVTVSRATPPGPPAPTNFMAKPGDEQVVLSWDAPASDSGVMRHEYLYKVAGESYPEFWAQIANSAVGGANEASFTVTGLTNEVPHTFQLRVVSGDGEGAAAMAGPVTPTPGICDRTQQVQDAILDELDDVDDCAAVTVADLETVTELQMARKNVTALKSGDFAGLSALDTLQLRQNSLTELPSDLFSGLAALKILNLSNNALESLPSDVFSGLTAMDSLSLGSNASLGAALPPTVFSDLTSLRLLALGGIGLDTIPAELFSGLSELTTITLDRNQLVTLPAALFSGLAKLKTLLIENNRLGTLPDGVFSGLSELTKLSLNQNQLTELSGGIFSGLSKLDILNLNDNRLTSLPAELFSGLTALRTLRLNGNPTDPMPLTVTLEKVETGQVRAKVLAGAPSDLVLPVSVENGTLAFGATGLRVAKGSVAGAPVSVIRTEETGEVTVDLGTPLPSLPTGHQGYEYVKAASGLPVEVPDALEREPGVEGQFRLAPDTVEDYSDDTEGHLDGHVARVEVFHAERWGTVCSDGFSKGSTFRFVPDLDGDGEPTGTFTETEPANEAPALVCQSMGYDTGEYASGYGQSGVPSQPSGLGITIHYPVGSSYLPGDPLPIWLDDLTCAAGDADLTVDDALRAPLAHCGHAGWGLHNCSHGEDAGVRCWNVEDIAPAGVAEPLTAAFEGLPEAHDGETAFSFRLAFSEAVAVTPEAMRTRVLTVAGGAATGAARVDGERGAWEITVTPDSRDDLSITLAPTEDCEAQGAVCTSDGRALSVVPAHIVPGPGPETEPALTASFEGLPEAHDGEEGFHFRVAFSEDIGIGFRSMRDDSFTVDGGEVTRARRVDRRHDLWRITVEPDGEGDVTVTLAAGRECAVSGAICTRGGDRRQLTNTATATVAGPVDEDAPAALTASFVEAPVEHDGETAFKLRIAFSEGISIGFRTFRDQSLSVSGGSVKNAKRVDRRKDLWEVTVKPGSLGDVTVTLAGGRACGTAGAVCTGDGRALSATISTTVLGPVALSVADARVREASDVTLDFAVTLSRASRAPVAVAYATADGSATAGSDYTATSGTLTFAAGETAKTVSVPVLDDAHDEGEETLTLRLSAATGAVIADGVATGTIENTDHMPAAWLARFGRTVTDQVLSVVEARLTAPRTAGVRATLAGQALPSWDGANDTAKAAAGDNADASDREAMTAIRDWMAHAGADGEWRAPGEGPERADLVQSRALTGRDFLTGTSFALTGGSAEAGGYAALWGRGAISRFDGREGDLTLDGEVTTGLMGADWATERWTAGLAIGHARGTGGYSEGGNCEPAAEVNAAGYRGPSRCSGEVEATLTGVWPYAGLKLTDRLSAWAAAGYGAGELTLTPGGESPFTADLTMAMGAAGMRGEVLTPPPEGGLALALKGDARFTRTASEATKDAAGVGNLAAATADVWLVRTGIEGSRRFAPGGAAAGLVLTPSFELGVRLDGGDAETGLGVDLGGGLAFAAPKQGVALDLKARGLVAHQASGFREWGASASFTLDPRPSTDRGLALTLRQRWGGSPAGGMDALLGRETLAGLAANDNGDTTASAGRLEAELGYGIAMFDGGFTGTPHLGVGLTETGRDYRLGWRLTSARRGDPGFEIGLDATRSEAANADAEHGIALRGTIRW